MYGFCLTAGGVVSLAYAMDCYHDVSDPPTIEFPPANRVDYWQCARWRHADPESPYCRRLICFDTVA